MRMLNQPSTGIFCLRKASLTRTVPLASVWRSCSLAVGMAKMLLHQITNRTWRILMVSWMENVLKDFQCAFPGYYMKFSTTRISTETLLADIFLPMVTLPVSLANEGKALLMMPLTPRRLWDARRLPCCLGQQRPRGSH